MLHCPRNMMMRTVAYCGFFLAICFTPALAADPTGDWKVADGVANIRVAECNGSMWGAVSWEKTPGGRDKSNPDASGSSAAAKPGPASRGLYPPAPLTAWPRAGPRPRVRRPSPLRHRQPQRRRRRPRHPSTRLPRRRPVKNCRRPRNPPIRLAISVYSPTSRGLPISAGWNNSTAASVVTSESANSLPMLAVPG